MADQLALAGESGIGKRLTSRSLLGTRLTTVYLGLLVGTPVGGNAVPRNAARAPISSNPVSG